jgi:hypothetical protein
MQVFVRSLVRPGVEVEPSPAIPATPEMALRPAGLAAVSREVERYHVDGDRLRAFDRPVYMSYGGLSSERWETMGARLAVLFPDCTVERYEGLPSSEHVAPGGAGAGGQSPEAAVEPLGGLRGCIRRQ